MPHRTRLSALPCHFSRIEQAFKDAIEASFLEALREWEAQPPPFTKDLQRKSNGHINGKPSTMLSSPQRTSSFSSIASRSGHQVLNDPDSDTATSWIGQVSRPPKASGSAIKLIVSRVGYQLDRRFRVVHALTSLTPNGTLGLSMSARKH
jgi:hypothetical protein